MVVHNGNRKSYMTACEIEHYWTDGSARRDERNRTPAKTLDPQNVHHRRPFRFFCIARPVIRIAGNHAARITVRHILTSSGNSSCWLRFCAVKIERKTTFNYFKNDPGTGGAKRTPTNARQPRLERYGRLWGGPRNPLHCRRGCCAICWPRTRPSRRRSSLDASKTL